MEKRRFLGFLALAISCLLVASALALPLQPQSNTVTARWNLTCQGFPVCLTLGTLTGNSTYITYNLHLVQAISANLPPLYVNTTIVQAPANVLFHLNGTLGRSWLNGPYSIRLNVPFTIVYNLNYNGTVGSYAFNATVVG